MDRLSWSALKILGNDYNLAQLRKYSINRGNFLLNKKSDICNLMFIHQCAFYCSFILNLVFIHYLSIQYLIILIVIAQF